MRECCTSAVGGKDDGDERRGLYLVKLIANKQRSSRLQVAHSSQAPLTIAGAPRTILDLTHRTLNAYYTRAGAHAHAQQAGTEMISCVSHTEYDTLRSTVIRCGDGWETILTWSVLQYTIPRKGSQPLSFRT